jgi:eukaryotic-like serine/threonine-protein kinase
MATTPIRELFDQAQPLAAIERAAFLDQHCTDSHARALIERLLMAADATDNTPLVLRDPAQWSHDIGESERFHEQPIGRSIGPFRLDALLGEGGSARVFRATRTIEGVEQTVALKVLRQSLANEHARLQFDRERNALVRLVHPNIAQFIDGGISEQGEAYIALEYVAGVQLMQYAREQNLPFRDRLRLMIEVARAVSAAHRSLIVHRDLKPANVLRYRQVARTRTGQSRSDTDANPVPCLHPRLCRPRAARRRHHHHRYRCLYARRIARRTADRRAPHRWQWQHTFSAHANAH